MGEVLCRLASHICCAAVKDFLHAVFLLYGQVGVDVSNRVEAAFHGLRQYINEFGCREDFFYLKIDFRNAFNECQRNNFASPCQQLPRVIAVDSVVFIAMVS